MKIVKIYGGLGNQMFQYAFGLALGHHSQDQVMYDLSWFNEIKKNKSGVTKREFDLASLKCQVKEASKQEVRKLLGKTFFNISVRKPLFIKEKEAMIFDPDLLNIKGDAYYKGYFQSEKYFADYRDEILNLFAAKLELSGDNASMLKDIKNTNSVSLHIRRGDYINLPEVFGKFNSAYYDKAVSCIASKVKNPHFYLFSDDIPWVLENFKIEHPFTVVDLNNSETAYCDMQLMKNCQHNIIANSTFSWWGAWLNQNKDKIVTAPKNWLVGSEEKFRDMVPDRWIKL